jgi:hypothetical protein
MTHTFTQVNPEFPIRTVELEFGDISEGTKKPMKKRTPEEWLEQIQMLPVDRRNATAKIIWWDFFGGRLNGKRWNHLDRYVQTPYEEIPDEIMLESLQMVGFTETQARQRIFPEERIQPQTQPQPVTTEI